jgi:uncharacterized membrane protein YfcA
VALSNVTILSGACSSFLFNVGRCRAHSKRPLIDWDLILIMEPTTIMGALLGSYLNKVGGMAGKASCPCYIFTALAQMFSSACKPRMQLLPPLHLHRTLAG